MIRRIFGSGTGWSLWPVRRIREVETFKDKVEPIYQVTDKDDDHQEPFVYNNKGKVEKHVRQRSRTRSSTKT